MTEFSESGLGEVIIEMTVQGNFVKVSAFHVRSLTEVSIVGDPRRSKEALKAVAVKKLRYVLSKKALSKEDQKNVG